ncbi:MAG: prephenate dehydrogenase [Actinobacteria bacterium]|nr:MAG: prephenate dehydrogenase [Actinomycetota bacterium]
MADFRQVTIIGTGLVGGSLGLAIKKLDNPPKVIGVARNQETLDKAIAKKAIDKGYLDTTKAVSGSDLVFLAVPVGSIANVLKEIAPYLDKGAIVSDVGSTKSNIVAEAEELLPKTVNFIGGHPMTGSEQFGVEHASANLFKNSYYILTPTKKTDTTAFQKLHSLLNKIGANVIAVDIEKHDLIVATISHLPHIIASALMSLASKQTKEGQASQENWLLLAAGGFRDTTRIAASNPDMWLDICLENKEAILDNIKAYQEVLSKMASLIEASDNKKLLKALEEARVARVNLPIAKEKELRQLREILIPVSDKPGVVSDITVTFGQLGLNIEDIEIVHTSERRGILRLALDGESEAKKAAKALSDKGYQVEVRKIYGA